MGKTEPTASQDDTARLFLMEFYESNSRSERPSLVEDFAPFMREVHGSEITTMQIAKLWERYLGVDRLRPTHDWRTGARI